MVALLSSFDEQPSFDEQLQWGDWNEELYNAFTRAVWGYASIHISKLTSETKGSTGKVKKRGSRLLLPYVRKYLYLPRPYASSDIPSADFFHMKDHQSPLSPPIRFGLPSNFFSDMKGKRTADYYRNRGRWETGIDIKSRNYYREAQASTGYSAWVMHLIHPTSKSAMDAQRVPLNKRPAPTGLFGCPVLQKGNEYQGMVYWGLGEMMHLATLEEVLSVQNNKTIYKPDNIIRLSKNKKTFAGMNLWEYLEIEGETSV